MRMTTIQALIQNVTSSWDVFVNGWAVKGIIAWFITVIVGIFSNTHVIVLTCFVGLVFIDLATKQIAVAARYVSETEDVDIKDIDFTTKLWGILLAFNAGEIKSLFMRNKFLSKMAVYLTAVASAKLVDVVIANNGNGEYVLSLMYTYLCMTEFISVLENLRDGGNATIGRVLEFAQAKILGRLK